MEKVSPSCEKELQNTPQNPPKTSPKSFQNTFKNAIEKNTIFNIILFLIWDAQNMKNVAPVEAKRYILQNWRFRTKYENDPPKHLQNPLKIEKKTTSKTSLDWRGRSFSNLFEYFPTFLNFFRSLPQKIHLEARSFAIPLKLPLEGLRLPNGIAHSRFP